ncbi:MAG: DUF3307 domain-containing protein, partial [Chitinispirillia bacterium]
MNSVNVEIFLKILVAHFLSDFIFQPAQWVSEKDKNGLKSWHLYVHIAITLISLFVILMDFKLWKLIIIITLFHIVIDVVKSVFKKTGIWVFVTDQSVHLITIVGAWLV